ncbi:hypothetical protein, partial [Pyramidobacter piscolens]
MDKNVLALFGGDETEALGAVEPFHFALQSTCLQKKRDEKSRPVRERPEDFPGTGKIYNDSSEMSNLKLTRARFFKDFYVSRFPSS